jgi:hypothetical protein
VPSLIGVVQVSWVPVTVPNVIDIATSIVPVSGAVNQTVNGAAP